MRKYLLNLIVLILVITGCSQKEGVAVNEQQKVTKQEMIQQNQIANIDKNDFITEMSIHDAVRAKDIAIIKFLISKNTLLNTKDKYGYTPLHLAVRFNELEIAKLLHKAGAKVNSIDNYKDTPLLDSTRNKFTEMSEFLICKGAYRNVFDTYDMTPLHYASKTSDLHIANMLRSKSVENYCRGPVQITVNDLNDVADKTSVISVLRIGIDESSVINDHTPLICGDLLQGNFVKADLTLNHKDGAVYGPYDSILNQENKRWCAEVKDSLKNGKYTAKVIGQNPKGDKTDATRDINIHILNSLYQDLKNEFKDDFDLWDAELDKDTLTFRFKSPQMMFKNGSSVLRTNYEEVLNDFYPRYVDILINYKSQIVDVSVEGHTSSVYSLAKNETERFDYNMELSNNRANSVVDYISTLSKDTIQQNKSWINEIFKPVGKSYLELVKNNDGSENESLSRRVEFRIKTIPNEM